MIAPVNTETDQVGILQIGVGKVDLLENQHLESGRRVNSPGQVRPGQVRSRLTTPPVISNVPVGRLPCKLASIKPNLHHLPPHRGRGNFADSYDTQVRFPGL